MSDQMIRFVIRTANVPNAAAGSTASDRCWWVAGLTRDGTPVAGFLPREVVTDEVVTQPSQLLGMRVEGYPAAHQKRPGSIWCSYLQPVDESLDDVTISDIISPVDTQDEGAVVTLHRAAGDAAYRTLVRQMVAEISDHLQKVSYKLTKTADAIKSIGNL